MKLGKITAVLTAMLLILGNAVTSTAGNTVVMADEIASRAATYSDPGTAESDILSRENSNDRVKISNDIAYTLTSVDATVKDNGGGVYPKRGIQFESDGYITITVSQPYLVPKTHAIVSLTGIAFAGMGAVELTAEPVTVEIGNTSGTDYTLKNADGSVSFNGKVVVVIEKKQYELTVTEASAAVTGADGTAVIPDSVVVDRNDSITITVPYNTPEGNVTINLTGKITIDNGSYVRTVDVTSDPVTIRIGNDRGANFQLRNEDNTVGAGGKVFVKKAAPPVISEPNTSTSSTSTTSTDAASTSTSSTNTTSTSAPSESTSSTSTPSVSNSSASTPSESVPSESAPVAAEKEFKPTLPNTSLDEETARVLGGVIAIGTNNTFGDGVVMNVKPAQTTSGFSHDITFTKNDKAIQPIGNVYIKIPVPNALNGKTVGVYRAESDGRFTDMKAKTNGGFVTFTTDHFSTYIITSENLANAVGNDIDNSSSSDSTSEPDKNNPNIGVVIAVSVIGVAALAVTAVLIARRKRK